VTERLFTAAEVQEVIEAVILYERARSEDRLHVASVRVQALLAESRREVRRDRHQTIDEIRASLARQEA
jgi:hypothetical protein